MTYDVLNKEATKLNEKRDCAVKALALVSGTHYAVVRDMLGKLGRKRGGSTPKWMTYKALRTLGLKTVDVTKCYKSRTIVTLGREMRYRKGKYLVSTSRHILAVVDGKVEDWTKGRRHRVIKIERVEIDV